MMKQTAAGISHCSPVNYELGENHDVQANYSRRIRRPGIGNLMPLINAQDLMNLRIGNPNLDPSITDNYELSHIRSWDNYMITSSIHRTTRNALTRVFILHEDRASMVTWTNAHTNYSTGLELVNYFDIANNYNSTITANFFHTVITGASNGESFSNSNYSWTLSMLGNFRIPQLFNVQVMGNYHGPRIIPNGKIEPVFALNLGLRRNILDQQGTISLNFSDIFNTRMFSLETMNSDFYQHRQFNNESRIITLLSHTGSGDSRKGKETFPQVTGLTMQRDCIDLYTLNAHKILSSPADIIKYDR